jgi:hypothetical protein
MNQQTKYVHEYEELGNIFICAHPESGTSIRNSDAITGHKCTAVVRTRLTSTSAAQKTSYEVAQINLSYTCNLFYISVFWIATPWRLVSLYLPFGDIFVVTFRIMLEEKVERYL